MGRPGHSALSPFMAVVISASVAWAQDGASDAPAKATLAKIYKVPIQGPELEGIIAKPGSETSETDQSPSPDGTAQSKPADAAFGAFQRGYYLTALKLALPRAESGDPAAQTLIAELYWNGWGVARDQAKAIEWYKFAADGGNRQAQFFYANMLLRGEGVKEDKKLGEVYMRKAAEAGHSMAQFNVAQIITAKRPTWAAFKSALPFYTQAAEAGVPDAQYALSNIYALAMGVPYNDEKTAFEWLQKAARGGFDTAQLELGIWYSTGRGGEKDLPAARFWFTRAAAQGNIIAQNRLARIYAFGAGVEKNPVKAGAWHILSRRAGYNDTEMDRIFQNMSEIDQRRAIEAANQLDRRSAS